MGADRENIAADRRFTVGFDETGIPKVFECFA
jgi:hypothetical protein